MPKYIEHLTIEDLQENPIWAFTSDDDRTISAMNDQGELEGDDYTVVILTNFKDSDGKEFKGYIYWGLPPKIEYICPVIITTDLNQKPAVIDFWHGIRKPSDTNISFVRSRVKFPVTYKSVEKFDLKTIEGILDGLYFITRDRTIQCIT
jgi:hypothetical protein